VDFFAEQDTAFGRLVVVLRGQASQQQTSLCFQRAYETMQKRPSNSTIIDTI
jgi:hypothetical protein